MPRLVHLILLFLNALSSYCLATIESKVFDGLLNQRQNRAGLNATKTASKALADKHFDLHGAKWPSRAFVQAVKEATLVVAAGASPPPPHAPPSPHDAPPRRVVLMAMANELAMRVTVPEFVRSLGRVKTDAGVDTGDGGGSLTSSLGRSKTGSGSGGSSLASSLRRAKTGVGVGGGGRSLASHLLLVCSSEGATELCRELGLGSRQDGGDGTHIYMSSSAHNFCTGMKRLNPLWITIHSAVCCCWANGSSYPLQHACVAVQVCPGQRHGAGQQVVAVPHARLQYDRVRQDQVHPQHTGAGEGRRVHGH